MGTSATRYAVVSCHVERPLHDPTWAALLAWLEREPGGFPVAALVRPPDAGAGEDADAWLERVRAVAARGSFGHHTHWTSPTYARPAGAGEPPGERVTREGRWLRAQGLEPTLFCGGGWYTDANVAAACADLGYVDCTPRARRPPYLAPEAPWLQLAAPAHVRLGDGRLLPTVATTHAVGDLVRSLARPRGLPEEVVHVYFHDTDLLDARRARALAAALRLLALRRRPAPLDDVAARARLDAPEAAWSSIARGGAAAAAQ